MFERGGGWGRCGGGGGQLGQSKGVGKVKANVKVKAMGGVGG